MPIDDDVPEPEESRAADLPEPEADLPQPEKSWADDPDSFCPNFPDPALHTVESHLAKLDGLIPMGNADKFFQVYKDRWRASMPHPGDELHSARAAGADSNARESRKRKASEFSRSTAETHAFCTSSNLSDARSDRVLEGFTNVSLETAN